MAIRRGGESAKRRMAECYKLAGDAAVLDGSGGTPGNGAPAPKRPLRPRELQDPLNWYLYHPLAWQLARRLASTPVTPNMVSVLGAAMVIAAAAAYAGLSYPVSAALGLLLHMGWHVVDGADGDLARLTGRSSPIGEMVDGLCDYLSHVVLYLVMGWVLTRIGGWFGGWHAWALVVFAGISHAVQANHVEVQRRQYQYWVYGTPWIRNSHEGQESATGKSVFASLVSAYLGVATGMTPYALRVDAAVASAQGDPVALDRIARIAREETQPLLLLCKILGPNPRALVLGLSMFAGSPAYYMIYQSVVLNLLLVWSVMRHNTAAKRIAARIAG
ncbi:CDP-alcohol phosphatidyltransferase family protein [Novosphingobium sp. B 225]|uniref:CDP-alcohol phosphatidyltransferase family protein n=1 Tax=Novosphingobium sp. B 225 TaxID=1961849 RepID=UPI0020CFDBBE|nr:CDP-alcohol phosphatidyltransferase family protein [Novosphingobium sp. B 225]